MKPEQAFADVELSYKGNAIGLKALVDTGASRSVVARALVDKLGAFIPLEEPYDLTTADKEGKLRITGYCRVDVTFQGVQVPGGTVFEAAENLREDISLIIGRPELDSWDIVFTAEGPKPRKAPIEFKII